VGFSLQLVLFGNVARTTVSVLIGNDSPNHARNASTFYTFCSASVGAILLVVMECTRAQIAGIYTQQPEIADYLKAILIIYPLGAMCELVIGTQNTLMRLIGKAKLMTFLLIGFFTIGVGSFASLFGFACGWGVVGMAGAFVMMTLGLNITYRVIIQKN